MSCSVRIEGVLAPEVVGLNRLEFKRAGWKLLTEVPIVL
jgi:hypothetical protein